MSARGRRIYRIAMSTAIAVTLAWIVRQEIREHAAPVPLVHVPRGPAWTPAPIDTARLLHDVAALAADSMEGRAIGTRGGERARRFLVRALRDAGVRPVPGADAAPGEPFVHPFAERAPGLAGMTRPPLHGANVVGLVPGTRDTTRVIVVSAHYDHLGVRDGAIYHGADDNASGSAAVLEVARWLAAHRPLHTVLFLLADGEERGLLGARRFVDAPPVPRAMLAVDVNLDMLSRSARGELVAVGAARWPRLRPIIARVAAGAPVTLLLGHDAGPPSDDWTWQSDQSAFDDAGIPFAYLGVEDHPDYHRPTDTAERIDRAFYVGAAQTALELVRRLDLCLDVVAPRASAPPTGPAAADCR